MGGHKHDCILSLGTSYLSSLQDASSLVDLDNIWGRHFSDDCHPLRLTMQRFTLSLVFLLTLLALAIQSTAYAQDRFAIESMIQLQNEQQKDLEWRELNRIAKKDNWCAAPNVKKNLVNYLNDVFVPNPAVLEIKKRVIAVESPTVFMASINNDALHSISLACSVIIRFADGTTSKRMTILNFPMNY